MNAKSQISKARRAAPVMAGLAIAALLGGVGSASAQVTFFNKPPSAAELRQALMGGAAPSRAAPAQPAAGANRPAGVRTRGIVWKQQGGAPANTPQPTAAAQSAAQPVAQAVGYAGAAPAAGMPINFASGSAVLAPESYGFINTVAEVLQSDPSLKMVIEGHTDSTGSYKRNMVLSWERAMGVYRVLVERYGIEPTRLQPMGKGPMEPMPGTAPSAGENRRVQFRLNG